LLPHLSPLRPDVLVQPLWRAASPLPRPNTVRRFEHACNRVRTGGPCSNAPVAAFGASHQKARGADPGHPGAQQEPFEPRRMPDVCPPPPDAVANLRPQLILALFLLDHSLRGALGGTGIEVLAMAVGLADHRDVRPVEVHVGIASEAGKP